jgi:hypothetical protein
MGSGWCCLYSYVQNKWGQAGAVFIVMYRTRKYILGLETYNEGIHKLKIKGKYNNITLINVHAPTLDKIDDGKEQFYKDIQSVVDKVQIRDIVITVCDLNAKCGEEGVYSNVTCKHT